MNIKDLDVIKEFINISDIHCAEYRDDKGEIRDALFVEIGYTDYINSGEYNTYDIIIIEKESRGFISKDKMVNEFNILEPRRNLNIARFYLAGLCCTDCVQIVEPEKMNYFSERIITDWYDYRKFIK